MKVLYGKKQERNVITEQIKGGRRIAEVTLGDQYLVHRYFFRTSYIAYVDIVRAYMRVAGGEFGEFPIDEYSLILEDREGKEHALHVDRPEYIREILNWLQTSQKHIQIGKKGDKRLEE